MRVCTPTLQRLLQLLQRFSRLQLFSLLQLSSRSSRKFGAGTKGGEPRFEALLLYLRIE